jgi:rubrerythrin
MDIGSIFLILAILVPVVLFITRPILEHSATVVTDEEHQYSALLAERDRVLLALQELEFDHDLGKIPEEAYSAQRGNLMRAGADILRQIDEYDGTLADEMADDRIEAAIQAAKLERTSAALPVDPDDEIEARIANRRRSQKENNQPKLGGFCPQCGNCVQESDRFCPKCGNALD